ncbi:MAG: type IV toxin-antitoxin system AbiEi family antitoxin, partial [Candidatus Symbiothrix sp.]|nr:type IV toxin-antitoxin system AbiEi family antitoxin [Candidatus Symbiothrix sp.]
TIYTNQNWQELKSSIGLIPDENGKVEVLQQFWKQEDNKTTVPPLLIYADLIGSGYGRNVETAKIILKNELPHIK